MITLTQVKHILGKIIGYRSFSIFVVLVGMIVAFWAVKPTFLSPPVVDVFLRTMPVMVIVTAAMALLLISGEFDLSVGSIFVLTAITMAMLYTTYGVNPAIAILAGLALGGFLGFINGILVTKLRIPSLITTLGTMWVYRGIALVLTKAYATPYYPGETSPIFVNFFCGKIWIIPVQFLWLIVVVMLLWILLDHTKFGNWIFATGSNRESARMMGINTNRVKIICFILVGIFAAFAGIIQATRIGVADPATAKTMNLEAIAGAVVGGTLITGGVGSILGAALGGMCIKVLGIGLVLVGFSALEFQIATGILLITAVAFNIIVRRRVLYR